MLELVLQGIDLLFKSPQGWSLYLSLHSPGWCQLCVQGSISHCPQGGFSLAQAVPDSSWLFAGHLLHNHLLHNHLLPTHPTGSWQILPSAPLLQAGGSSSLSLSSPDPPHVQTHRAAGPGFNCAQVLPHVAGTDLSKVSTCHLVSVLTKSKLISAQSSSASPSQRLLSASFPSPPPHTTRQ